jgi:hypothetical protein
MNAEVADHVLEQGSEKSQPGTGPVLSAEDQAEVNRLAGDLAGADLPDADLPDADLPGANSVMSHNEEAAMAIDMIADMAEAYDPSCAQFWPKDTRKKCAIALGAVLKKYNFSLFRSPELVLMVTLGPPLFQTSKAIAQVMNAKAAEATAEAAAAAPGGSLAMG